MVSAGLCQLVTPSALAHTASEHCVESDGVPIRYRGWNAGETDKPTLLLVHGYARMRAGGISSRLPA